MTAMTCEKCGASTRTVVERVFGFIAIRELCSAGHSRHLGIESILPPERPIPPKRGFVPTLPPLPPANLRVCRCGVSFIPKRVDHIYHDRMCERTHRNHRRRKRDVSMATT